MIVSFRPGTGPDYVILCIYENLIIEEQSLLRLAALEIIKLIAALWALQASRRRRFHFNREVFEFAVEASERALNGEGLRPVHPRGQLSSATRIAAMLLGPKGQGRLEFRVVAKVLLQDSRYPTLPLNSRARSGSG